MRGVEPHDIDAIHRLWRQVIIQAIDDALSYLERKDWPPPKWGIQRRELMEFGRAYRWISRRDPGFLAICSLLDIRPGPIVRFLKLPGALEIRNGFFTGNGLCQAVAAQQAEGAICRKRTNVQSAEKRTNTDDNDCNACNNLTPQEIARCVASQQV